MSFEDLIKDGVALAKELVGDLRTPVQHISGSGANDGYGPAAGSTVTRLAFVEDLSETIIGTDGTTVVSLSKLTFLEPVPVDPDNDEFIIPTNPNPLRVLKVGGFLDPAGSPYVSEVWLGIRR